MPPQVYHILVIWGCRHLEKQMQGKAFSELPSSASRQILQKELSCHKSPPGSVVNQGGLTLVTGEDTRS